MKRKIFIPLSLLSILTSMFLCSLFLISFVYVTVGVINGQITSYLGYIYLEYIIVCISTIIMLFLSLSITIQYTITIKDKYISIWGLGKRNITTDQYYCEVEYSKIKNIDIIPSKNDSLNKKITGPAGITIKEYLEFTLIDDSKKRFNIFYFSKKQMRKILIIITERMKNMGNENYGNINIDNLIKKQWNTYQEYKRKYLQNKK